MDDNWGYPCDLGNLHMISKISAFPPECSSLLPWRSLEDPTKHGRSCKSHIMATVIMIGIMT